MRPPAFWEKDMEKWKKKFEDSNKKTIDAMQKIQRSYHYNFFVPAEEEKKENPKAKSYSRFTTVDPILLKGNTSTVMQYYCKIQV